MPLPNPTVNIPRLSSRPPRHSRSPSHSPVRQALDYDPLLSDLTPTRTLHAFADDWSTSSKHDSVVLYGLEGVSPSERALGTRAAQTCITLRAWCRELESWEWPNTFDVPESARAKMRASGTDMSDLFNVRTVDGDVEEHWGSLPARTVQAYDRRIDDICRDLDTTDVEELKDYVLNAHQASGGSIDDSYNSLGPISDLRQLDDYTAIVTATILQALPFLSRIHMLLDIWTIRLSILRQTPGYLRDLKYVRMDLDHAWTAITSSRHHEDSGATFTLATMHRLQDAIQQQVKSLAQRLDSFLDELEGSPETLPELWIEEFENLEAAYVDWVVHAERRLLENEWLPAADGRQAAQLKAEPALTGEPLERVPSESYAGENPLTDEGALVMPSSRPASMVSMLPPDESEIVEPYVDPHANFYEIKHEEADEAEREQHAGLSHALTRQDSPSRYSRHVPITTEYDEHSAQPPSAIGYESSLHDLTTSPPAPPAMASFEQQQPSADNVAKMRAIFLNGEIEQSKSLRAQVKSPVRPFERATNAFTQLFRRDKTPELSRSSSNLSEKNRRAFSMRSKGRQSQESERATPAIGESGTDQEPSTQEVLHHSRRASSRNSWRQSAGSQPQSERDVIHDTHYGHVLGRSGSQLQDEALLHHARPLYTPEEDSEGEERQVAMADRPPPETYKPTRLEHSPRSQSSGRDGETEYPADWPLVSPPTTQPPSPVKYGRATYLAAREDEISEEDDFLLGPVEEREPMREINDGQLADHDESDGEPDIKFPKPLEAFDFDRLFVHSLPTAPNVNEQVVEDKARPRRIESKRRDRLREPIVGEDMFHGTFSLRSYEREGKRASTLSSGDWEHQAYGNRGVEERPPVLDTTRHSEGNIKLAEPAELSYIGPQWIPSHSSSTVNVPQQKTRPNSMPAMGPVALKLKIPGSNDDAIAGDTATRAENVKPGHIKRASLASIDSVPRSQVKTIELQRRSSKISGSRTQSPSPPTEPSDPVSPVEQTDSSNNMRYKGLVTFPSPPPGRASIPMSPVSPIDERDPDRILLPTSRFAAVPVNDQLRENIEEPPSSPQGEMADSPAPICLHNAKRRGPTSVASTPKRDTGHDAFDRHVSQVLERLPSQSIRFKSRPGAETPESSSRTSEPRSHRGPRPKNARIPPRSEGSMIIAPAEVSSRKTESEIKLYHLTQADNEHPIKLFVRIVGEGERVMVRVGGGWQDLADFLRQFASHHGSRTASGSALEVVTAENSAPGSRKVSSSAVPIAKASAADTTTPTRAPAPRPGSRMDMRKDDDDWLSQPQPTFSMGDDSTGENSPASFRIPGSGSRPGTADSAKRPTSSAGRRGVLDEQKSQWVENMIEKARMSAEKSKDERVKYFGELGRAGGTRRVVFRSSSAADGRPDEKKN